MRTESTIKKWGNGLALRLSGPMRDIPGFEEGMGVEVEISSDGLIIRPKTRKSIFPYTEEELIASMKEVIKEGDLGDWLEDTLPSEDNF
ncbi:hypothetical protein [Endozoicomonas sp.]|uniref:AbrB/MazE/SpoVT family DNA-binding domain-containing protein n=1 Tax=Endozoicomonas sp. TaxID=1892382 RepID=UPI002887A6F5|nr:hypothetical protein [Endozoicomonas sp.]